MAEQKTGWKTRAQWFVRRTVAWVIDQLVINGGGWGVSLAILYGIYVAGQASNASWMSYDRFIAELNGVILQLFSAVVTLAIGIAVQIGMLLRTGTTPGKWLVRMEVRDFQSGGRLTAGQAWRRFFASAVSYLPFLAGYLMALFQRQGRALHDIFAGTAVVPIQKNL